MKLSAGQHVICDKYFETIPLLKDIAQKSIACTILATGLSFFHLEATFIESLEPLLFSQKKFVYGLKLFSLIVQVSMLSTIRVLSFCKSIRDRIIFNVF